MVRERNLGSDDNNEQNFDEKEGNWVNLLNCKYSKVLLACFDKIGQNI